MLSPDDALGPSFDVYVRNFFDPIWNQLSRKIQQLINEVKVVKTLFKYKKKLQIDLRSNLLIF